MRFNWLVWGVMGLTLAGCVGGDHSESSSPGPAATEFDYNGMMANYADNLIIPRYRQFAHRTAGFAAQDSPLASYCAAIGTESEASAKEAVQAEWRRLMAAWQGAELFLVGPAAANDKALRNRIYSYNTSSAVSTCAVDQSVVLATDAGFDIRRRSFNSRGLGAMEYLLFNEDLSHTCPTRITETQGWDQRSVTERRGLRCEYARVVAQDLADAAQTLALAWTEEGGHHRYRFVDPNHREDNLKALSDALFYIETESKDAKLGVPLGLHSACSQTACPESTESKYSRTSLGNIRQNLLAFKQSFNGGQGLGFDDIIRSEGFPNVARRFDRLVDDAVALIDQIETPLYDQSTAVQTPGGDSACINSAANPDSVQQVSACSLHGLLKRITDALRTDFVTIVNLDLPDRAQSDND